MSFPVIRQIRQSIVKDTYEKGGTPEDAAREIQEFMILISENFN